MLNSNRLDGKVLYNFSRVRLNLLLYPLLLLFIFVLLIFLKSSFTVDAYVNFQKDLFFYLNNTLAEFPNLQFNLTQLGDALIILPLVTVFIIYVPKIWGAILNASLLSLIASFLLKKTFSVPRPAAMLDNESFTIIGETLSGNTSLPSGHTITIFTTLTILLFSFMPKKFTSKIIWFVLFIILGATLAFSRVGVGAHYPLDVIFGGIVGYICALLGIVINNNVSWWNWIGNKKYYPIFMVLFILGAIAIINKILDNNLLIFYVAVIALCISLYVMIRTYVKK